VKTYELCTQQQADSQQIHQKILQIVEWGLRHLSLIPLNTLLNLLNKRLVHEVMRQFQVQQLDPIISDLTCFLPALCELKQELTRVVQSTKKNRVVHSKTSVLHQGLKGIDSNE